MNQHSRPSGWLPWIPMLLVLSTFPAAAVPDTEDDPFLAWSYEVRYRSLSDAADLVGELLSEDGTLTLKPQVRSLIVQDRLSVLEQVEALLEHFDIPPRAVEVTLSLFLGLRDDATPGGNGGGTSPLSREVRGVIESMRDFTRWTSYEPLGSRSITGVEGDPVIADITAEYRVAFTVESVHEAQQKIKFERFSLQRVVRQEGEPDEIRDLYTAGMVVEVDKLNLMVAASAPDSKRALFLALQATPR